MIDLAGRKIILANINGVKVPFYLSTGSGNKAFVESGKWYPFFGLDPDGWFNKGTEDEINDFYGSAKLKEVAEKLNKKYGDIRNTNKGVEVVKRRKDNPEQFDAVRRAINQDVHNLPYANMNKDYNEARYGQDAKFKDRIKQIIAKINKGG